MTESKAVTVTGDAVEASIGLVDSNSSVLQNRPGLSRSHRFVLRDDQREQTGSLWGCGAGSAEAICIVEVGQSVVSALTGVIDGGDVDPREADTIVTAIVGRRGDADFWSDIAELGVLVVTVGSADSHRRRKLRQRRDAVDGVVVVTRREQNHHAEPVAAGQRHGVDRVHNVSGQESSIAKAPAVAENCRSIAVIAIVVGVHAEVKTVGHLLNGCTEKLDANQSAIRRGSADADVVGRCDREPCTRGTVSLTGIGTRIVVRNIGVEVETGCPVGKQIRMKLFNAFVENGYAHGW